MLQAKQPDRAVFNANGYVCLGAKSWHYVVLGLCGVDKMRQGQDFSSHQSSKSQWLAGSLSEGQTLRSWAAFVMPDSPSFQVAYPEGLLCAQSLVGAGSCRMSQLLEHGQQSLEPVSWLQTC